MCIRDSSFPSRRGIPVTERVRNGVRTFSVPSFWIIEINFLSKDECFVRLQVYGCYKNNTEWFGVWKPKVSKKFGTVIEIVYLRHERDYNEIIRKTRVSKRTLINRLAQAKRLLSKLEKNQSN